MTQAVRLPVETRFPKGVKKVSVRIIGRARIIEPLDNGWDSFFYPAELLETFNNHAGASHGPLPGLFNICGAFPLDSPSLGDRLIDPENWNICL